MKYTVLIGDRTYEIRPDANQTIEIDGEPHRVDFRSIEDSGIFSLLIDNRSWQALVERAGDEYRIFIDGEMYVVNVQDERTRKIQKALNKVGAASGEFILKAPMPGLVRHIPIQVGQEIAAGQGLIILEAMKMENELRAPRAGVVREVRVKPGDAVELGQTLVIMQ
ncbi:MAG: acetyl-CoA carboxylase biotin carboxyl carrier protein subunit [Chloroflexi bacterium]|nr:MAG: acetyl-CoA carboxylase biotin carboxyl carrier protein subunit [Chloroflexota bacterium]